MEISLRPEVLIEILGVSITNTFLFSFLIVFFWIIVGLLLSGKKSLIPDKIQNFFEFIFEKFFDFVKATTGSEELAREFFPFFITFFLLIFSANIVEILPGVESGLIFEGEEGVVPLFRAPSSDWSFTLALAILGMIVIHCWAIKKIGPKAYVKKFINFHPIYFFVGLLEIVSEFAKVLSLSLRLYINILVGGILLLMTSHFFPFFLPLPLLFFEIFVSFIQALVFSLLILIFWTTLIRGETSTS